MADFSHQDMLGFMDDDERQHYESAERTQEERDQIHAEQEKLWNLIPTPTEDQLKPPYMLDGHWSAHQQGAKGVLPFYVRRWKRQRKAAARAELERRGMVDSSPPKKYRPSPEQIKQLCRSRNMSEAQAWAFLESDTRDAKDMLAYLEYEGRQIPPDDLPREEFRDIQPNQNTDQPSEPKSTPSVGDGSKSFGSADGGAGTDSAPIAFTSTRKRKTLTGDNETPPPFKTEKNTRLKNALDLLTQHPKLSAGGGATVFLIAAVSLEFSGGKPWKVGLASAIGYLLAFLLLVFVFYEARLFANHVKGTIAASAAILITIATLWYLLLPDAPLTAQDIATEVWKRAPTPLQNPSPAPSTQQLKSSEPPSTSSVLEQQRREIILDRKGVAIHVGMSTLYPQMQIEYIYQTDVYRFVVYVDNTNLTLEVCIRLLDYYPELKAEMLKGVENSSEFYPDLRMAVNSGLVINYKSSLTKEQIDYIKRHAKRLKVNVWLEGPAPP